LEMDNKKITEENPLADLLSKQKIGDEISLKVLREGKEITLKVPEGTKCGQKFRVKGMGVVNRKSSVKGDLFIRVSVLIPKASDLDSELAGMLETKL